MAILFKYRFIYHINFALSKFFIKVQNKFNPYFRSASSLATTNFSKQQLTPQGIASRFDRFIITCPARYMTQHKWLLISASDPVLMNFPRKIQGFIRALFLKYWNVYFEMALLNFICSRPMYKMVHYDCSFLALILTVIQD